MRRKLGQLKKGEFVSKRSEVYIQQAVNALEKGGVISFPTETYYGLGVDPFNTIAVGKLFELKQREYKKPILVLVANIEMLNLLVTSIPVQYRPLMDTFWPGPLTLIFQAKDTVNTLLTGDTGTVGVRISSNPIVTDILKKWKKPLTATSANISSQPPAKSTAEVLSYFGEKLDYIINGGTSPANLCSSIVAFKNERFIEIRKGQIAFSKVIDQIPK